MESRIYKVNMNFPGRSKIRLPPLERKPLAISNTNIVLKAPEAFYDFKKEKKWEI